MSATLNRHKPAFF